MSTIRSLKKYPSLSSETFKNSVREGAFYGMLLVESDVTQLFKNEPIISYATCSYTNGVCQNLKMKTNFIENVFHVSFSAINYSRLCESYIFLTPKYKKNSINQSIFIYLPTENLIRYILKNIKYSNYFKYHIY